MIRLHAVIAALLLLCLSPAIAQDTPPNAEKSKYTSIRLGLNFATIAGQDIAGTNWQPGAHAGVYLLTMETDKVGIQTEVQYSLQGSEMERGHLLLHYITVPVTAKYFFEPNTSIQGGAYGALLVSQKYEFESFSNSPGLEGIDYGLAYGFSYGDESKYTISLRHHLGLANVLDKSVKAKNHTIQLSIAFCVSR